MALNTLFPSVIFKYPLADGYFRASCWRRFFWTTIEHQVAWLEKKRHCRQWLKYIAEHIMALFTMVIVSNCSTMRSIASFIADLANTNRHVPNARCTATSLKCANRYAR